jgi:hypothetical protein
LSGEWAADGAAIEFARRRQGILKIGMEEARQAALEAIADESRFEVIDDGFTDKGFILTDEIRSFLEMYPCFVAIQDDLMADSKTFYRSLIWPDYIVLGTSPNGFSLLNREGQEAVVEVGNSEGTETDREKEAYPTIFHWVLARG